MSLEDNDFLLDLPMGAPPILPDVHKQLHDYIASPKNLVINDFEKSQQHWDRQAIPENLLFYDLAPLSTFLRMNRDPTTGELLDISEVSHDQSNPVGNGIDVALIPEELEKVDDADIALCEDLLTKPDAFERGYDFGQIEEKKIDSLEIDEKNHFVDLSQLMKNQEQVLELIDLTLIDEPTKEKQVFEEISSDDAANAILEALSKDVEFDPPVLNILNAPAIPGITSTEWAEMLDVSQKITDFHQRIPCPARTYEFELDTFQQQAILKLEEHCNVLVSAHTSAGKTVVAEYAIALTQRHQTRTIYTSPIKALSNQKYREFRRAFKDVGLVTGDFEVNSKGACLVVTTEILRSMLLAQNDVIRDLEFVIFDEVHYINDMDRGHVWEEVLILLPSHVSIVMLSATIPNALEFADWVGRSKQRRMYVVSTLYRPVPLKHFLYTGSGGSTKNERFLIMDGTTFKRSGYLQALEAKQKRQTKVVSGPRDKRRLNPKQESTMWVALIEHLLANDELPVVAFTLSRKRCDMNAEALVLDLTTAREKSHIKQFFNQSVVRLKPSDRELPQIRQLENLLERGIGVHHSGILPILKEIVELLFQERCVKVLFATETFAMGVNMPAKTVVFDSINKYDGMSDRLLLPSEYIQMAGRAGRRGLDKNGNVLILCKGDVPSEDELMSMMTGNPKKIESQFRLTYSIILKLERKRVAAEGKVTVEEMMASSFMEVEHVKQKTNHEVQLMRVNQALAEANVSTDRGASWKELEQVSRLGLDFLDLWHDLSPSVLSSNMAMKEMKPGRVLVVTHGNHVNKIAVLLNAMYKKSSVKFQILVLTETSENVVEDNTGFYKLIALISKKVFVPKTLGGHLVLTVDPWDILEVTVETININRELILNDWENRQIPRFRDNPPGPRFQALLEDLLAVSLRIQMSGPLQTYPLFKDMKITNENELISVKKMMETKKKLEEISLDEIVDWQQQLEEVFRLRCLEKERENLSYLLSYKSMSLYSDYQSRLLVLREFDYIDSRNSVMLKGNVACEMNTHELLITELVLRNALDALQPAEIAALLSCFVYKGKDTGHLPDVPTALLEAIITIGSIEAEITSKEIQCGVQATDPFHQENLNFDLVPVVYEWAQQKPFSDIMMLTDIQEGVIVRCIQQLNQTIKDVRDAARIVGEPTLQQKMDEASNAIKRDIVFAASLYMQ